MITTALQKEDLPYKWSFHFVLHFQHNSRSQTILSLEDGQGILLSLGIAVDLSTGPPLFQALPPSPAYTWTTARNNTELQLDV